MLIKLPTVIGFAENQLT